MNLHSVFSSYLDKNLSKPRRRLETQEAIRHLISYLLIIIRIRMPINMQILHCLAIVLPGCVELKQRKLLAQKQQETEPLRTPGPSKNKGELLFIREWHWRTAGTSSRINLRPNKQVACSITIPEFRIKTEFKPLQMLR